MSMKNTATVDHTKSSWPTKERSKHLAEPSTRLKTVVRRLPPNLPESVFWQSVEPWVSDATVSWKAFYPGKFRKRLNKENIPSRAYLLFKNEESLGAFGREYDGHLFRDKQGNESQVVVEFAPNQKVPSEKKKVDSRHATIQQDEDYLSFVASLEDPVKPPEVSIEALLASTIPPEEPKMTPLLAALQEQKQAAQEKKIAIAESAKARKAAATVAAMAPTKQEAESIAPTGKKSRRGKGSQPTPQIIATAISNGPSAKASSGSRGRGTKFSAASAEPTATQLPAVATPAESSSTPASKEAQADTSQKRNRPVVGLQSRHLKAALTGAGVQVATTSTSAAPLAPDTAFTVSPKLSASSEASSPKSSRARGEKKDGVIREGVGRGGKEKGRPRPTPAAARPADGPPRILTRQEPPPPGLGLESLVRDKPSTIVANHSVSISQGTTAGGSTTTVPTPSGGDSTNNNAGRGINIGGDPGGNHRGGGRGGRGRGGRRGRGQ